MAPRTPPPDHTGNRLLDALPSVERQHIASAGASVPLAPGDPLHDADESISHVYFPTTGVVSLITPADDETWVETAIVGNEGMIGIRAFLGGRRSGNERAIGQVNGTALRIAADAFRAHQDAEGKLRDVMLAYTQALMSQMAQSAVCNAVHEIAERCARWMLQVHDRIDGDQFRLTHEFLSNMLGVRRSSVTVAAGTLQKAGLIQYRRGHVTITNRSALENASCECYAVVKREYAAAIGA